MTYKVQEELNKILKQYQLNNIDKLSVFNWYNISYNQTLSEPFIDKYQNKANWKFISKYQILSEQFIKKYKKELNIKYLLEDNKITQELYDELIKPISRFKLLDI